jgi:dephospho-CoA kinase
MNIIGLTGAFGSGSTTAAKHLRDTRQFVMVRLSDSIRTEWAKTNQHEPSRLELQRLGNELRQKYHPGVLVELSLSALAISKRWQIPRNYCY